MDEFDRLWDDQDGVCPNCLDYLGAGAALSDATHEVLCVRCFRFVERTKDLPAFLALVETDAYLKRWRK